MHKHQHGDCVTKTKGRRLVSICVYFRLNEWNLMIIHTANVSQYIPVTDNCVCRQVYRRRRLKKDLGKWHRYRCQRTRQACIGRKCLWIFFSSSVVHICVWSMSGPIVPDSIPMEWTHECDVIRPSVAAYCKPQCQ